MNFLRNSEIKKDLLIMIVLTLIFSLLGLFLSKATAVYAALVAIIFIIIYVCGNQKRYKKIETLSELIDRILHGEDELTLDNSKEGELAILESEIYKMTLKLREHSHALQKEKIYLTDSIADISHQLRTPLTTINLLLSKLQRNSDFDNEQRKTLIKINKHLGRIDWLITALLKMAKIEAGTAGFKKDNISVSELITKSVESLLVPMELREQQFVVEAKGDESYKGDLQWSKEAVGNIIKNCMEHTPIGGKIEVCICENAIFTEIKILDNGNGINEKDLPYIFRRFYRGENSGEESVGIGLALAKQIIAQQNGTIKAENKLGKKGATFTIRFYKNLIV